MAATIRFLDGVEATLVDEEGTWECVDEEVKAMLKTWTEVLPFDHHLDPIGDVARKVAEQVGAEVIHTDPPPKWDPDATH
jgi:hypothetical protein